MQAGAVEERRPGRIDGESTMALDASPHFPPRQAAQDITAIVAPDLRPKHGGRDRLATDLCRDERTAGRLAGEPRPEAARGGGGRAGDARDRQAREVSRAGVPIVEAEEEAMYQQHDRHQPEIGDQLGQVGPGQELGTAIPDQRYGGEGDHDRENQADGEQIRSFAVVIRENDRELVTQTDQHADDTGDGGEERGHAERLRGKEPCEDRRCEDGDECGRTRA